MFFIVIVNFLAFTIPLLTQSVGKPYAKAKAYVTVAKTINAMYIFPLSQVFGYKNILAKPFYPARDYFYNKGISLYPKDEGEREIQWFTVRYAEYDTLIHPLVQDFATRQRKSKGKDKMLLAWQDELTSHLEPFSTLKIEDDNLRKFRFNQFVNYALSAFWNRKFVVNAIAINDPNCKYANPILRNSEELKKLESVILHYEKLKQYAENNEQDGLDYFYNETKNNYIEEVLKYEVSNVMLEAQMVNNTLDCNGKYSKIYGSSFTKLLAYANSSNRLYKRLYDLGIIGVGSEFYLLKLCADKEPTLKTKYEYVIKHFRNSYQDFSVKEIYGIQAYRNGKYYYY